MIQQIPSSKLVIGGALLGFKYGVSPNAKRVSEEETRKILSFATEKGIQFIDTARVYGESEEVIGRTAEKQINIISKCTVRKDLELPGVSIQKSLKCLGRDSIYAYLIHGPDFLLEVPNAWEEMLEAKASGLVKKIGFSLYKPELLFKLIEAGFKPDIIQVQFNILDRRFEPYFRSLRESGTEIHVRSAFIQGLFFLNQLPDYLLPLADILKNVNHIYPDPKERSAALLSFCIGHQEIDKVVLGISKQEELALNLENFIPNESNKLFELEIPNIDDEVLLPYNWPIYRSKS
jgi:aryl-alcohol dehydrogenase-like predicted oxidoreductase